MPDPSPEEHVSLRVVCGDAQRLEIAVAEAWEAGASGVVEESDAPERGGGDGGEPQAVTLYAPRARIAAVRAAVAAVLGGAGALEADRPVHAEDWAEHWKRGLTAVDVSPRLRIRPSFIESEPQPGRVELVIDPGQAFGTGGHASTTLALEWLDECADELAGARVLDVGTGTGVLAIAALRLGAARAVGLDLDPLAAPEARHWARRNGVSERLALFTGPVEALAEGPAAGFDWVLANLLRRELLPIVPAIAGRLRPGGHVLLSGLLAPEQEEVEAACAPFGLRRPRVRGERVPGEDPWISMRLRAT